MVPKITRGGASFKGAFRYYLHDKGADTSERIEWLQIDNMTARTPEQAWRAMAYTAKSQERLKEASGQSRAGRKLEKPVFAFSLAWHPEQTPDKAHMLATARAAIAVLGLEAHEAVIVSHADEPHKHVHVIVNRVHPLTGMAGDISNSKRKFSDFAREYEEGHGKIYCQRRAENHARRKEGEQTRYADPQIAAAWEESRTGTQFREALKARGFTLAQGRKRIVIVDPHGKVHNPTRLLKGVRAHDIQERLSDIEPPRLPDADEIAASRQSPPKDAASAPDKVRRETKDDKHQRAFDRLAAARLADLSDRQKKERADLAEQIRQRLIDSQKRLVRYYHLPQQKEAIARMREKIDKAAWWRRLFGFTRKDKDALREQIKTYRDGVSRYRESLTNAQARGAEDLRDQETRHGQERNRLILSIEELRERGARRPHRVRQRGRFRDRDASDRGRDL